MVGTYRVQKLSSWLSKLNGVYHIKYQMIKPSQLFELGEEEGHYYQNWSPKSLGHTQKSLKINSDEWLWWHSIWVPF